jgi:hypothetical protein
MMMVLDLVDPSIRSCPVALPAWSCRHYSHEMPASQACTPTSSPLRGHPGWAAREAAWTGKIWVDQREAASADLYARDQRRADLSLPSDCISAL